MQRFGYAPEDARQDGADLAEAALALALEHRITAYDATYVALARMVSLPLITADQALLRQLAAGDVQVCWLGDWPI